MKMKLWIWFFLAGMCWPGIAFSNEMDGGSNTAPKSPDQRVEETARDLTLVVMESLREFLDEELRKIKSQEKKSLEEAKAKIKDYEDAVKMHPDDPGAYFALGEIYDQFDQGADAIVRTLKAEKLFLGSNDIKGVAEARRNLRNYYAKYGFKPEDFNLNK